MARRRTLARKPRPAQFTGLESLESRTLLSAPVFVTPLVNITAPDGSDGTAVTIGVDGFDADADALTITAVSDDPDLDIFIPQGNRFARIDFEDLNGVPIGSVILEIFETRGGDAAERFITLATNEVAQNGDLDPNGTPFYTDVLVHRITDLTGGTPPGFIVQTGDAENSNGTGGSPLGDFDDQFNLQDGLSFFGKGVFAFANSGANTNDSQIFATDGPTTHLDGKHMIFGQLIVGEDILEQVIALGSNKTRMASVIVGASPQDGTITFTPQNGWDGTATVTVTLDDGTGEQVQQEITIVSEAVLGDLPDSDVTDDQFLLPGVFETFNVTDDSGLPLDLSAFQSFSATQQFLADPDSGELFYLPPDNSERIFDLQIQAFEQGFNPVDRGIEINRFKVISQAEDSPQVQSRATSGANNAFGSFIDGNLLYVANGSVGLEIYDISDPTAPALLDTFNTAGTARDVTVRDGVAYVADNAGGFITLDVSDPDDITALDTDSDNTSALSVLIDGNVAYVPSDDAGLIAYDISDPANVTELDALTEFIGGFTIDDAFFAVKQDNVLFLSDPSIGILAIDASDPADLTFIGLFGSQNADGELREPEGLDLQNGFLYAATAQGLSIFDVSDPNNPDPVVTVPLTNLPSRVAVSGNLAVVALTGGFAFIDIQNPASPNVFYAFEATRFDGVTRQFDIGVTPSFSDEGLLALPIFNTGTLVMDISQDIEVGQGSLTVTDGNGVEVTIRATGDTPITVVRNLTTNVIDQLIIGDPDNPIDNPKTSVTITSKGGDAEVVDIIVHGNISSFTAKTTDLLGDMTVNGKVTKTITLDDIADDHTITITEASATFREAVSFVFDQVTDLVIDSAMHIKSLTVGAWQDLSGETDAVNAPSLAKLTTKAGNFGATLNLTGVGVDAGKPVLGKAGVKGIINPNGDWTIGGAAGAIKSLGTDENFGANITGDAKGIDTGVGDLNGTTLAANSWAKVKTKGNLNADVTATGADAKGTAIGSLDAVNIADGVTVSAAAGILKKLKVVAWETGTLIADTISSLASTGNFGAVVTVNGVNAGTKPALNKASFKGAITTNGKWNITGAVGAIKAAGTGENFEFEATGNVKGFDTGVGDLNGVKLTANSFGKIKTKGTLSADVEATGADAKGNGIGALDAANIADGVTVEARQGSVKSLKVVAWEDGELIADTIATLATKGAFGANVTVLNNIGNGKAPLNKATIKGLASGIWNVRGDVGSLIANAFDAAFRAVIAGDVKAISSKGAIAGFFSARSFAKFDARGDANDLEVRTGTDLGPDGQLAGGDDTFTPGNLSKFAIKGAANNLVVRIAVNPIDDVLDNGNDTLDATSTLGKFDIGGTLTGNSIVQGVNLPALVKIGGAKIDTANDARFTDQSLV